MGAVRLAGIAVALLLVGCTIPSKLELDVQIGLVNWNHDQSRYDPQVEAPYKANQPWLDSGGDGTLDADLTNEGAAPQLTVPLKN